MTSTTGSYHVAEFAANLPAEIRRLDTQVDLFWRTEKPLLMRFGLSDGMAVLDCGCGPGRLLELFADDFENLTLTGLEIDPILVEACRERFANSHHQVEIFQGAAETPGLVDSSFDLIVMRLVLEHVPDPVAALQSLSSLLKPGGRIVIIANDFEFHLRTSPSVAELDPLYEAYCASRRKDGGDPCIGRQLPVLFTQAGLIVEGFEMEVSHSKLVGDQAFFQAEGVGIPAQLVESGFLDQQVFEDMIRSWKQMLKDPNHSIMRPLFVGVARLPVDADLAVGLADPLSTARNEHATEIQPNPHYVAPSSKTEEVLETLWRSAMHVSQVGVRCNFFDLGGDSLMLEQLQSDIQDQMGLQVPMAVLFEYPTIEQLAAHLDRNSEMTVAKSEGVKTESTGRFGEIDSALTSPNTSQKSYDSASLENNRLLQNKAERRREALSNKKRRAERGQ